MLTLPRLAPPCAPPESGAALKFLYGTAVGRLLLKALCGKALSRLCGRALDTRASRVLIPAFVRRAGIDLSECEDTRYGSFNDFFTRRLRSGARQADSEPEALIAPCDGMLSAYRLHGGDVIPIKQSGYTVSELLGGNPLAARFEDGLCLVFRLGVGNYHRYCRFDGGTASAPVHLDGVLHTVRPVALGRYPVFVRNAREYSFLESDNFGLAAQIEVGAMLVGRIENRPLSGRVERGDEKGMFLYGGSTVVLLLRRGAALLPEEAFSAAAQGLEIPVKMGERIGIKAGCQKRL